MLSPRHDMPSSGGDMEPHWGYFDRELPCMVDAGKCAYLDVVYHSHDLSVLYTIIMWAVILGILLLCFLAHYCNPVTRQFNSCVSKKEDVENPGHAQSSLYRMRRALGSLYHRFLIGEFLPSVFGNTTRFNVLILVVLTGYLTVFSFVGNVYKTWYSPVEGSPDTIRVGMGPWADRIGVLAYALTPLSILLCTRESILSLVTGIPYHHFNFLHRWLGYIIYIQATLHTISWTIVEGKLYQPQPSTWNDFIKQEYIIWGVVAMILLTFLVVFSTQWAIRLTGYEFFRKSHYIIAMIYIGACWGHWDKLACWMIASLVVWLLDRSIRLLRTFILHFGAFSNPDVCYKGLLIPKAHISHFPNMEDGDVVRLDFQHDHAPWDIGQHFYLCFPDLSIWQSHPMTPSSVPGTRTQSHTYIIRAKGGITRQLANIASHPDPSKNASTPIIVNGPYGQSIVDNDLACTDDINLFFVAGGTGITFILPLLQAIVLNPLFKTRRSQIEVIWIIRRRADMHWVMNELDALRNATYSCSHLRIRIFVSRENERDKSASASASTTELEKHPSERMAPLNTDGFIVRSIGAGAGASKHPDLAAEVGEFVSRTVRGPTRVVASGPVGMIRDLKRGVANCCDPGKVLKGEERFDVEFVFDDRLEY
ncbi:hypothetical protein P170DRAFT_491644 [Aspergillus steynii IBT 23096]|uniref:ferric-chelate reductase (NADPH) n=1 Tax=Aspergillus steynii IBT 23096 TaxID=1392250 RepID=A0A2I2GAX1_9EURO|nr:uncharacterized protein P170DRAFT_491644 [Aspergillus steynii IBT 23096]PLB50029.1 hypothetical protein P170DRAFT_491644 [Aspergillus steynii IBT 23096]